MQSRAPDDERVLHTSTVPSGQQRTLSVTVRDGRDARTSVMFIEKYTGTGTGWLGRFTSFRVEALIPADPDGRAGRLVADVSALVDSGQLDLPPEGARDRVAELMTAAGFEPLRRTTIPWVSLPGRTTLSLHPDERPPAIKFWQHGGDGDRVQVVTAYESMDRVAEHLARRFPQSTVDLMPGDRIGRFIATFTAFLAATGEADPPADRVARLYGELGVPAERRSERRHELLRTYRDNTDCAFSLTLLVSSIDDRISFTEFYDYYARPGDSGREYGYSAITPYGSLDRLVAFLEGRLGHARQGDPADRLVACFRELVDRGELSAGGAIETCRNLVGGWFTEAGVPYKPDFWVWFDSD